MTEAEVAIMAAPNLLAATLGTSLLLLDRRTGATAILDPGTALVWTSAVVAPVTPREIAAAISRDLGGSAGEHLPHVRAAVSRLLERDLVGEQADLGLREDLMASPTARRGTERRAAFARRLESLPGSAGCLLAAGTQLTALTSNDAQILDHLTEPLRDLVTTSQNVRSHQIAAIRGSRLDLPYRVFVDGSLLHRAASPTDLLRKVMFELNAIARTPNHRALALHAGAVERNGRVLLIAGPSGSGKSTLTAALVRNGARYVTDEVAVIDLPGGRVQPFAKPIDLASRSWELIGADLDDRPPSTEPAAADKRPLPVGSIGVSSPGGTAVALLVLDAHPTGHRRIGAPDQRVLVTLQNAFAEPFRLFGGALLQDTVEWAASLAVERQGRAGLDITVPLAERLLAD